MTLEQVDDSMKRATKRHELLRQILTLLGNMRTEDEEGFDWILDRLAEEPTP